MIRPLRRTHRAVTALLWLLLPVVALAIAARGGW